MAIKIRCPKCYRFNSAKNVNCSSCAHSLKGSKNFYIQYTVNKKSKYEYAGVNITQAKNFEAKRKYEIKTGNIEDKSNINFSEYVEKVFIPHYEAKNKSTITELSKFHAIVQFFGGEGKLLKNITSEDIEKYYQYRLKINKPATAKNHLAIVRRMLNYAVEMDYLKSNPIKTKSIKFDNKRIRFLNTQEKLALLEECKKSKNPNLYYLVSIALDTGMRLGEIKTLKKEDVRDGVIMIKAENTKNSTMRIIPLTKNLKQLFSELEKFNFNKEMRYAFKYALKRAGIENFHFHDLRHTFASDLVMKGVDLYTVSKLLGHASIEMTQRYSHLAPSALIEAIKRLN